MSRPKIGLALSSGVGRGWAHIGVLKALAAANIEVDVVAGTSIGALVGGVHLAGHLDLLEEWALNLNRLRIMRYIDLAPRGGGIIGGRRLQRLLRENLGHLEMEHLPKPFVVVATELENGHEIWLRRGPLVASLQASYALPGVFPPVELDGHQLVDGALVNPVPVSVCRALGARLVIAVNLNADMLGQRRRAPAGEAEMPAGAPWPAGKSGVSMFDGLFGREDSPSMISVMATSLNILQDRLGRSRLAGDPPDVTIAPRVGHIGLLEFDRAEELIAEGEAAVQRSMPFLDEALAVLGD
ncbi:MAG: patatin-like phospholipase family protein [Alphaproteobacteria bacterium]|nr:patatin-like phospholipase family protein [Alphaproteobacteria bacterium]MDP6563720.1 patatin-like phospholipase family protein [Alphaproteobacteria bacterium]MDP6815305.1 patatin-like phospholipase family protein [Alphaproteobacteria bacterium]